jgi:hypothetical protein
LSPLCFYKELRKQKESFPPLIAKVRYLFFCLLGICYGSCTAMYGQRII